MRLNRTDKAREELQSQRRTLRHPAAPDPVPGRRPAHAGRHRRADRHQHTSLLDELVQGGYLAARPCFAPLSAGTRPPGRHPGRAARAGPDTTTDRACAHGCGGRPRARGRGAALRLDSRLLADWVGPRSPAHRRAGARRAPRKPSARRWCAPATTCRTSMTACSRPTRWACASSSSWPAMARPSGAAPRCCWARCASRPPATAPTSFTPSRANLAWIRTGGAHRRRSLKHPATIRHALQGHDVYLRAAGRELHAGAGAQSLWSHVRDRSRRRLGPAPMGWRPERSRQKDWQTFRRGGPQPASPWDDGWDDPHWREPAGGMLEQAHRRGQAGHCHAAAPPISQVKYSGGMCS